MENVIIAIYRKEATTYQVLSDLKNRMGQSAVLQAGIIQNISGSIVVKDGWTAGGSTSWASGGLLGTLVGILGGPVGMLLGAGIGMLVGSAVDAGDMLEQAGVIESAAHNLQDGYLALIAIVDEPAPEELDGFFRHYGMLTLIRRDVAAVQEELYQAEEAARELRKQARVKMREQTKQEWKHKAQEVQHTIKGEFAQLKEKIYPQV